MWRATDEQQCQGWRENSNQKALRLAQGAGLFHFREGFERRSIESSVPRQARQPSTGSLPEPRPLSCGCGLLDERKSGCGYSIWLSSGRSARTSARNVKWIYNGHAALRSGSQYRQDPRLRGAPLTLTER